MITNETFLVIYLSAVFGAVVSVLLNEWVVYRRKHNITEYFWIVIWALVIGSAVGSILWLILRLFGVI